MNPDSLDAAIAAIPRGWVITAISQLPHWTCNLYHLETGRTAGAGYNHEGPFSSAAEVVRIAANRAWAMDAEGAA